ncbi:MAG: hypothetical protein RIC35_02535 [Marinoscillum sp.]
MTEKTSKQVELDFNKSIEDLGENRVFFLLNPKTVSSTSPTDHKDQMTRFLNIMTDTKDTYEDTEKTKHRFTVVSEPGL